MKIKKILLSIFSIFFVFTLTGCINKKVINSDKFISISKKYKLTVSNVTNYYKEDKRIKKGYVSSNLRGWRVEFYEFNNEDNAEKVFNTNKKLFEKEKTKNSTEASSNWRNYSTYTLTTSLNYYYLCRVENTMIYVKVDLSHKKDVKKFIDKLGY